MIINLGSKNPVKLGALRDVLDGMDFKKKILINSINADSEVPDQPIGHEETVKGAKNRAVNSYSECDFGIGIESGLISVPHTRTGYMNVTACAVYDGKEYYIGLGPAFELPPEVTRLVVEEKLELDEAVLRAGLTDNERIGYSEGIIGIMTKGRVTRLDYSKPAIEMALAGIDF